MIYCKKYVVVITFAQNIILFISLLLFFLKKSNIFIVSIVKMAINYAKQKKVGRVGDFRLVKYFNFF